MDKYSFTDKELSCKLELDRAIKVVPDKNSAFGCEKVSELLASVSGFLGWVHTFIVLRQSDRQSCLKGFLDNISKKIQGKIGKMMRYTGYFVCRLVDRELDVGGVGERGRVTVGENGCGGIAIGYDGGVGEVGPSAWPYIGGPEGKIGWAGGRRSR